LPPESFEAGTRPNISRETKREVEGGTHQADILERQHTFEASVLHGPLFYGGWLGGWIGICQQIKTVEYRCWLSDWCCGKCICRAKLEGEGAEVNCKRCKNIRWSKIEEKERNIRGWWRVKEDLVKEEEIIKKIIKASSSNISSFSSFSLQIWKRCHKRISVGSDF
jgi:hypothetical protein